MMVANKPSYSNHGIRLDMDVVCFDRVMKKLCAVVFYFA